MVRLEATSSVLLLVVVCLEDCFDTVRVPFLSSLASDDDDADDDDGADDDAADDAADDDVTTVISFFTSDESSVNIDRSVDAISTSL